MGNRIASQLHVQAVDDLLDGQGSGQVVLVAKDEDRDASQLRLVQQVLELGLGALQLVQVLGVHDKAVWKTANKSEVNMSGLGRESEVEMSEVDTSEVDTSGMGTSEVETSNGRARTQRRLQEIVSARFPGSPCASLRFAFPSVSLRRPQFRLSLSSRFPLTNILLFPALPPLL